MGVAWVVMLFGFVGGHKYFREMYLPPPSSEMLVTTCKTTWHHNTENHH
jgi:hypothetical protein